MQDFRLAQNQSKRGVSCSCYRIFTSYDALEIKEAGRTGRSPSEILVLI
nr:MAG TPA: hypothetical protein [Caudoviricetes sp.]DAH37001.1 MAG TPA: hypothetical protein [Caudoviricetes sp.]